MSTPPKARPAPRVIDVVRSVRLTPHMQRVTFSGEELESFPADRNGGHIKIFLPNPGQSRDDLKAMLASGDRPTTRTYTVSAYRPDVHELDIDFVVHGDEGAASSWATRAAPGDFLGLAGPGEKKLPTREADWFLFCADMSAMPAACGSLEDLPPTAKGHIFFEITSQEDIQPIAKPDGMSLTWLIHSHPHKHSTRQLDAVQALDWPEGRVSVFVAGEASVCRAFRFFLLRDKGLDRRQTYISGYWKIGLVEDEHQAEKRDNTAAEEAAALAR